MIRPEHLVSKAKAVWSKLDNKTKGVIQCDYPFTRDRDEAIYNLRSRGVEIDILAEITCLSKAHIPRIEEKIREDRLFDIRRSLGRIRRAFEDFYEACVYYTHGDENQTDY